MAADVDGVSVVIVGRFKAMFHHLMQRHTPRSLDRYCSVITPVQYIRRRTKRRALVMISVVWFLSLVWLVPILGWHHFQHENIRTVPRRRQPKRDSRTADLVFGRERRTARTRLAPVELRQRNSAATQPPPVGQPARHDSSPRTRVHETRIEVRRREGSAHSGSRTDDI